MGGFIFQGRIERLNTGGSVGWRDLENLVCKVMRNFVCETKEHRFVLRVMEDMRGF